MANDPIFEARSLLEANGYVVLKEKSYRAAQERQRIAERMRECEQERRESTEQWARECCANERRAYDRVTRIVAFAMENGATYDDLRAFDARGQGNNDGDK